MSKIPKEWIETTLGKLSSLITKGTTPKTLGYSYIEEGIKFIKVENINSKGIDVSTIEEFISEEAHLALKRSQFEIGDILFSIAGTIGKTAIVEHKHIPANTNQAVAIIRGLNTFCNSQYIQYQLKYYSESIRKEKSRGGGMNNVSLKDIKEIKIDLTSKAEQDEIESRLELLLGQVDKIKTRLDRIPAILKSFRQSVLSAAVTGKLTEDWRGTEELIGWETCTVEELATIVNGKSFPSKEYQDLGVKLLRPGNLHVSGEVVWNSKNTTYLPLYWIEKRPELLLKSGVLLMNMTAQSLKDDFLGRVCINKSNEQVLLNQRICCFDSKSGDDIIPFLFIYFRSVQFRSFVSGLDTGSLIKHLNIKDIRSHILNTPKIEERALIVDKVNKYFKLADSIESKVKECQSRVDNLTQSILAKAFCGDLTKEWRVLNMDLITGDNSAFALLEKIKIEQEKLKPKKKSRKKK